VHDIADLVERCAAGMAGKALLVIPPRQAVIGGFDRTTTNLESAASTFGFPSAAGTGDQGRGGQKCGFDLRRRWRGPLLGVEGEVAEVAQACGYVGHGL
jgi:hypothetical protein